MRKSLFVVCSLIAIEIVFILLTVSHFTVFINNVNFYYNHAPHYYETLTNFYPNFVQHLIYAIVAVLANLLNIAVIITIAITNFPVFKPLVDKRNAKRVAHKEQRTKHAQTIKQQRIEKLQAELDKLKKDE